MIGIWLPSVESETFYSVAARLHHRMGFGSAQATSHLLFGYANAARLKHAPRSVHHFCCALGNQFGSPDMVLERRSVVGIQRKFAKADATPEATMRGESSVRSGWTLTGCELRYCPTCCRSDTTDMGAAVWRLEHQLPGIFVCCHHHQPLVCAGVDKRDNAQWLRPEDTLGNSLLMRPPAHVQWLFGIACAMEVLRSHPAACPPTLRQIVTRKLSDLGVLKSGRWFDADELQLWWAGAFVKVDSAAFAAFEDSGWIKQLWLGRTEHPLPWALLVACLMTPEQLCVELQTANRMQATIEGEWENLHAAREAALPHEVWTLLDNGLPITVVAAKSGIPERVLRHWLRQNPHHQEQRKHSARGKDLLMRRAAIIEPLLASPGLRRADLLRLDAANVRWLERHDSAWIAGKLANDRSNRFRQRSFDF